MIDKLFQLIADAKSIVITSHLGPDYDSVCSAVVLQKILELNFPDKETTVALEEESVKLSFIAGYDKIVFGPLAEALTAKKPDLLIILDANSVGRCSRQPEPPTKYIKDNAVRTMVIDHHEPEGKDETDLFIHQKSPAVAQDIYELFIDKMGLKKPEGYAQILLAGIYADTGGFVYKNPGYAKTFGIAAKLIDDGANLEAIKNQMDSYTDDEMRVVGELIKNLHSENGYNFSFIGDDFTDKWLAEGKTKDEYKGGCEIFVNDFIRNVGERRWGFVTYRDLLAEERTYSVSFRAVSGTVDVSAIARTLGGGGHKPAAGAKITANTVKQALEAVKNAIESVK